MNRGALERAYATRDSVPQLPATEQFRRRQMYYARRQTDGLLSSRIQPRSEDLMQQKATTPFEVLLNSFLEQAQPSLETSILLEWLEESAGNFFFLVEGVDPHKQEVQPFDLSITCKPTAFDKLGLRLDSIQLTVTAAHTEPFRVDPKNAEFVLYYDSTINYRFFNAQLILQLLIFCNVFADRSRWKEVFKLIKQTAVDDFFRYLQSLQPFADQHLLGGYPEALFTPLEPELDYRKRTTNYR